MGKTLYSQCMGSLVGELKSCMVWLKKNFIPLSEKNKKHVQNGSPTPGNLPLHKACDYIM